jgi:acyl dehydratase
MTGARSGDAPVPLVVPALSSLPDYAGTRLGTTTWITITQERIDAFADATGDHQWIHCDPERAARESPWKQTIAHGYLTLSLAPALLPQLIEIRGVGRAVNTGIEKMRLSAPVPSGSRVRMTAELKDVRGLPGSGMRASFALRFEVEGTAKPACIANATYVYFP